MLRGWPKRARKDFKFENKWLLDNECHQVVKEAWENRSQISRGSSMQSKLKTSRIKLRIWCKETFGSKRITMEEISKRITEIQQRPLKSDSKKEVQRLKALIDDIWKREKNRRMNSIYRIKNSEGIWLEDELQIRDFIQEAMACRLGVFAALGKGFNKVIVESDNINLIRRLNGNVISIGKRFGTLRVVNDKVVGIDLGTTNLAVEGGKPTIITNAEGIEQRRPWWRVPRVGTGDRLVGQIAKRQAVVNPENTFFSVKRFMGIKISEVDEEYKHISYKISRDDNGNVKLECPVTGKRFAAEEISAQVLRKLVDDASKFLNDEVTKAVVIVPAYFNDSQRMLVELLGTSAG
ncbi:hypothetical protein V6N12_028787 [Hibiscus sabdariffa]|uniref:Uncharacterized protein n=1 Tax=Hibiscus sabdariffa TaxID=183260 RepID=A0ABR2F6X1_9ROSI